MDLEKITGGLVGLAAGDALGVPVEFVSRDVLRQHPVEAMHGYGTHSQPPGTWSDDSSLAFCATESLVEDFDLEDMGRRFVRWHAEAYWTARGEVFDIGGTTCEAIHRLSRGTSADSAGPNSERDNGNGYVDIGSDGRMYNKSEDLASYRTNRVWEFAESDEYDIRPYGDIAILIGRWRAKGKNNGHDFDYAARFISVYVNRDGRWQMLTSQSTTIPGLTHEGIATCNQ